MPRSPSGLSWSRFCSGGCGSTSPAASAASPAAGKSLQFKNGWNFVALGPLDTQNSRTVVSACQTNFRPVSDPTEPRAWELGCEAAGAAIARWGRPLSPVAAPRR